MDRILKRNGDYYTLTSQIDSMKGGIVIKPKPGMCIATVAKGRYWKAVDEYMKKGGEDTDLEEEIELLRNLLEDPDLEMYRARVEDEILNDKQAYIVLSIDDAGCVHKEVLVEQEYSVK